MEEACAAVGSLEEGFVTDGEDGVKDDVTEDFYTMGALNLIVEVMKIHARSVEVQIEATEALKSVTALPWLNDRKLSALENGAAEMVSSAMQFFSADADMQLTGCAFITAIGSTDNERVTKKMIELDLPKRVLEAMKNNLGNGDEDIQVRGIFAIFNICFGKKDMAVYLNKNGAKNVIDTAVRRYKNNSQIKKNAISAQKLLKKKGQLQ